MDWNAVNGVVAVLGLIGGLVGFARSLIAERNSRAARADADDARSDAVAALTKSADAEERIAKAVELIAGEHHTAAESRAAADTSHGLSDLVPKQAVAWSVEKRIVPNSYRVRNIGTIDAQHVTATAPGYPAGARRFVAPGAAFTIGPPDGRADPARTIVVNWTDRLSAAEHSETYPVQAEPAER